MFLSLAVSELDSNLLLQGCSDIQNLNQIDTVVSQYSTFFNIVMMP